MSKEKTIEEIESYLRSKNVSGVMAIRLRKIAESFVDLDAFFSAKREDICHMFNRITPGGKKGLGWRFWPVFKMALAYYNGADDKKETAKASDEKSAENTNNYILAKMHTYDELKSIVDMMEFCNIESINFLEISGFLENVRFRQKKAVADAPAEENHD